MNEFVERKKRYLFIDFDIHNLLTANGRPVGGSCLRQYYFGLGLREQGHEVGYLTHMGIDSALGEKSGFTIVPGFDPIWGIRCLRWLYYRFPRLIYAVRGYNPDYVIQTSSGNITGLIAMICKILSITFVHLIASDIDVDHRLKQKTSRFQYQVYRWGLWNCPVIVCQNQYQAECLRKRFPEKKIGLLPNPIQISETISKHNPAEHRSFFAWVGNFRSIKNLQRLLRIVKKHQDVHFVVAGKRIENSDSMTDSALRDLEKCRNVNFTGYLSRSEVFELLARAKALLNTSDAEGFPNTYLEALLAGTPVISLGIDPNSLLSRHEMGFVTTEAEIGKVFIDGFTSFDYESFHWKALEYLRKNHDHRLIARKLCEFLESPYPV